MLDQQEARELAEQWLAAHPVASGEGLVELCLLTEATIKAEFGWVFSYTTKLHIETGEFSDALVGNAPLIVDKQDGKVHATGTAHALEHYIEQYRSLKAAASR